MDLQTNPELELAFEYVRNTDKSLFLTGKAGSGKTTFLHQVKADGRKRLAVVAPTGVAAINAGGMTIHSLFQLPFGIYLPGAERSEANRQRRFAGEKVRLIQGLDLLVIDEISMVRADTLDAIDEVLRRYRNPSSPFGGVQLLMIGDLHQLPPVVRNEDWDVLSRYYDTPYFFGSRALQQIDYVSIELKHIYRQADPAFIALLNKVRDNCLDDDSLRTLNSRFVPNFQPSRNDAYITLTATNATAQEINATSLQQLNEPQHAFQAEIVGEFPASSYPTEQTLEFKKGAQVMFIKNDLQPQRRYFNGKIGRITHIDDELILVRCPGDDSSIAVARDEWPNVKYSLNEETKQIEEQVLGMFIQYPLKLAWAITIHKSQGLTFDRAIVDAQAAFAHGQVYVALSRCRSFEGIVLRSRINAASVKTDPIVRGFSENIENSRPDQNQLQEAKREFQAALLRELFRFHVVQKALEKLLSTYSQHASALPPESVHCAHAFAERAKPQLFDIATKFAPQLAEYLREEVMPEQNEALQVRVRKASAYFTETTTKLLRDTEEFSTVADNQQVAAALATQLKVLRLALFVKLGCFAGCEKGFSTTAYSRAKINAELDFRTPRFATQQGPLVVPKGVPHPVLYRQLLEWRQQESQKNGKTPTEILPNATLKELVTYLPTRPTQLREIRGIGKARLRRYGGEIMAMMENYCAAQQLSQDAIATMTPERPRASQTQTHSFALFQAGKGVAEIAAERGLSPSTIEGHLSHFIGLGELDIHAILDRDTVAEIEQFLAANPAAASAAVKAHFEDKYGYGEITMVMSHIRKAQPRS
ncbi:MAG: AAA family ATPase [Pirellulaceae bacterium]|nr:AAA family ATPase [Planctomycetales bacterium]